MLGQANDLYWCQMCLPCWSICGISVQLMVYRGTGTGRGIGFALFTLLGCSRTGLEVDERVTLDGSSANQVDDIDASAPAPTLASRHWITVPTLDANAQVQLQALRLGRTTVEDVVQLNQKDETLSAVWGDFSRQGRGLAVSGQRSSGETQGLELWDLSTPIPASLELRIARPFSWGPWLGEHSIIVVQAPNQPTDLRAQYCAVLDLDHIAQWTPLDVGIAGSSCGTFYAVSPGQTWLVALAVLGNGSQSLVVAPIINGGLGSFVRVADIPNGQTPANVVFAPHDDYFVLENVDMTTGLRSLDLPVIALGDSPSQVQLIQLATTSYLNFAMWAPSGPRLFVHTTRIDPDYRGSNPIYVVDAQTGNIQEVTARYFSGSTPGLTVAGLGIVTDAYSDSTGSYGMQWTRLVDLAAVPPQSAQVALSDSSGNPIFDGYLRNDGSAFFGLSTPLFRPGPSTPGPVDLTRYEFGSNATIASQPTVRLSSYADVRRWLASPDENYLVYHVAVTSDAYASADLLTQGHYTSEAGTFLLPLSGGSSTRLAMDWNSYQSLLWLPDSAGLLRMGPASPPSVEADMTIDDGQLTLVDPSLTNSIFWFQLDGAQGRLVDLTPYLGKGNQYLNTWQPGFAKVWPTE